MATVPVTVMCGTCYRPATGTVYRRPLWRRVVGLPANAYLACDSCVRGYARPRRIRRVG